MEFISYQSYISQTISSFIKYVRPNINIIENKSTINESAQIIANISAKLAKMIENASRNQNHLIYVSLNDLQYGTDEFKGLDAINWSEYLKTFLADTMNDTQIAEITQSFITTTKSLKYFELLLKFLNETPKNEFELYIWWSFVEDLVVHTTEKMRESQFQHSKSLTNVEGIVPRSILCAKCVNNFMSDIVAYYMIDSKFLNETMSQVQEMMENIKYVLRESVANIDWLDEKTREVVFKKIDKMRSVFGISKLFNNTESIIESYRKVCIEIILDFNL